MVADSDVGGVSGMAPLPPGQRPADLQRFGLPEFARRQVNPPARPVLTITGAVRYPGQFDLAELLDGLPRRDQRSDLHCVTTWSARDLAWSGVRFEDLAARIAERVQPHPRAEWLMISGLDGYRSCLFLPDLLADDVLLADHLHGTPLSAAHGAPVRLVAPRQYGYKSVKHLATLDYHRTYTAGSAGAKEHPRGRVDHEERSRLLPGLVWRRIWSAALPAVRREYQ